MVASPAVVAPAHQSKRLFLLSPARLMIPSRVNTIPATPMRCSIDTLPARKSTNTYSSMNRIGNIALSLLVLVVACSALVDGAKPKEQRRGGESPYLVSPPGVWPDDNVRPPPKDLGERVFVSGA